MMANAKSSLTVSGDRFSDDADVVRLWAMAGAGIAYKSWLDVAADVLAGRLKVLMPELLCESAPLNLLCAHRAQLSKPVNLLREMLASRCARYKQSISDEIGCRSLVAGK